MRELDIRALFALLLSKWKWIVTMAVVLALTFGVYSKLFVKPTYCTEIQMYVSNYSDLSSAQGASTGGLTASQELVKEYIVILRHDSVMQKIAERLREKEGGYVMTSGAIRGATTMTSLNETAMLSIKITTQDPALSKALGEVFNEVAPKELERVMQMGTVTTFSEVPYGVQVGPNVMRNAVFGGLIGAVGVSIIVFIMYMFDNTVAGERELKQRLNVTVLGEVPNLHPKGKGGVKNGKRK